MEVSKIQSDIKPSLFWTKYVSQRQPVVISGFDGWTQQFTDDFLLDKVGDVPVMVEQRSNRREGYGQGHKVPLLMKQLVRAMQQGDTSLYMSTQEVGTSRVEGHPLLYGPPLLQLVGHFPLQQPLMGQLVPQSINMWMGCAPEGSSSGLHHDFHDNLYVLLRGCKRFRLYPPSTAADMYVRGTLLRSHPNGRLVYEGQGDVNADGSDAHDVKLWQAHLQADAAAAAAAAAAASGVSDEAGAAEAALEQQLDAMLDEAVDGADMDDYLSDSDDAAAAAASCGSDADDGTGQHWESNGSAAGDAAATQHTPLKAGSKQGHRQAPAAAGKAAGKAAGSRPVPAAAVPPPPSFCEVDLLLPEQQLRQRFPLFPGVAAALEVVLQAGDALYLPAGWFHEVTSFGAPGLDGGHLALNWWYHPPDNLDSSRHGFRQPYNSSYYPTIWAQRKDRLHQETLDWWQHKMMQQQKQQQQQQPVAGAPAVQAEGHDAPAAEQPTKKQGAKRHIEWAKGVHNPPNKYHTSMTRDGSATGNVHLLPFGSGQGSSRPCVASVNVDSDGSSDTESPAPCSRGCRADNNSSGAHAAARRSSPGQPKGLTPSLPSSVQEPGDLDDAAAASAGPDDDNEHAANMSSSTQDGLSALDDYFSGRLDAMAAMKDLVTRAITQGVMGRRQRGTGQQEAGLALPWLPGRRHHYTVTVKEVPRRPVARED